LLNPETNKRGHELRPNASPLYKLISDTGLNTLQLPGAAGWSAVHESIAVVDPWEDGTTSQCLHEICLNEMTVAYGIQCAWYLHDRATADVFVCNVMW